MRHTSQDSPFSDDCGSRIDPTPSRRPSNELAPMDLDRSALRRYFASLLRDGLGTCLRDDRFATALESFDLARLSWMGHLVDVSRFLAQGETHQAQCLMDWLEAQFPESSRLLSWWKSWASHQAGFRDVARVHLDFARCAFPDADLFLFAENQTETARAEASPCHAENYACFWPLADALAGEDAGFVAFARAHCAGSFPPS